MGKDSANRVQSSSLELPRCSLFSQILFAKLRNSAQFSVFLHPLLGMFMIEQVEITLKAKSRGFHLVTSEILSQLPKLPKTGIINIFCKHTSCGLSINENADPDVRVDMETISTCTVEKCPVSLPSDSQFDAQPSTPSFLR